MASHERDWAGEARHRAHDESDPLLLGSSDIIHFAELLIREDHGVLAAGFQFWGGVADYFNKIMHLPEQPGRQTPGMWSEYNRAVSTAVGYVLMSSASTEVKLDLLHRYFPPPRQITADSPADLGPEGERLATEEKWT